MKKKSKSKKAVSKSYSPQQLQRLYNKTQKFIIEKRLECVTDMKEQSKIDSWLPRNPSAVFGDLWPGTVNFFAPTCMTVEELFKFMKERRIYDVHQLVHSRRRDPSLRIPRSPITFYSAKDYNYLIDSLRKLREEHKVPQISLAQSHKLAIEQTACKRPCNIHF